MKNLLLVVVMCVSSSAMAAVQKYKTSQCEVVKGNYVGYRYGDKNLIEKTVRLFIYENHLTADMRLLNTKTGKTQHDQECPYGSMTVEKQTATFISAESLSLDAEYPETVASVELKKAAKGWTGQFYYDSVQFAIQCAEFEEAQYGED